MKTGALWVGTVKIEVLDDERRQPRGCPADPHPAGLRCAPPTFCLMGS